MLINLFIYFKTKNHSSTTEDSTITTKTQILTQKSSTEISPTNLLDSMLSPPILLNKNFNFTLNDQKTKKSEKDLIENGPKNPVADNREKNSTIESHIEKTQLNSLLKDKNIAPLSSSTHKNLLYFNSGSSSSSDKSPSTDSKNNPENNQINLIKNNHSLFPLSPTFHDDFNQSPRSFTGSLSNEPILNNASDSKEKDRIFLESWSGSIDLSNTSLYVKGYPQCGKHTDFYNELKERYLNKKLSSLLIDAKSVEQVDENLKNHKSIFTYLQHLALNTEKELIFIRFDADKSGKSKINLSGSSWQMMDSEMIYNMVFKDCSSHAGKCIYYKISHENVDFIESFFLFPLGTKKDQNGHPSSTSDQYFSNTHQIRVVRKSDYIMGVIIRKERMPPPFEVNNRKRKESSVENNSHEDNSKRLKMSNDTSLAPSSNISSNIPLQQSISVAPQEKQPQHLVRDPRLLQRTQNQTFQISSSVTDSNLKEMPLVSLPPSTSLTPIPELARETIVNKEINDLSRPSLIVESTNFLDAKDKELKSTDNNPTTSINDAREKNSETLIHTAISATNQLTEAQPNNEQTNGQTTYETLVETLDLIIEIDDKDESVRQEQLQSLKNSVLLDEITDEDRERILHSYRDKLPDFVYIVLDSSKNEKFKIENIQKIWKKSKKQENQSLPSAEKWLGSSREQVLERIKVHKSGVKLSLENENWKQTKRSFELVEPNIEDGKFKNTFHSVCD